jgi:hypothetical protein
MSFFDNDDLNDMYSDWEKRMRERMRQRGEEGSSFMGDMSAFGDDFSKLNELGEPDSIEEFEEGGVNFIKKTWKTEHGEYVMVETVMDEMGNIFTGSMTLEEKLEEALENEEYEKAAELRDRIADKKVTDSLFSDKKGSDIKKK